MQFQRGDLSIDYSDDGEGLPIVLLHAFATDRTLWAPQIAAFRERHRVIAPTLRGFFRSCPVDGRAVSMDRYADDVIALLDHVAIGRAVIGGISLGGYVALSLALRHPARVAGLVLANTRATADDPQWASYREALVRDVESRGARAVIENYGDKPFSPACPEAVKREVRAMIAQQPARGLASGIRGMAQRPDRTASLAGIEAPTLVIAGTEDTYIPSTEGQAMHHVIVGSRFVDIPGAGHLSNIDSTVAFNAAMEAFLQPLGRKLVA
jgi:3-oxoadipate enol-lactonase